MTVNQILENYATRKASRIHLSFLRREEEGNINLTGEPQTLRLFQRQAGDFSSATNRKATEKLHVMVPVRDNAL